MNHPAPLDLPLAASGGDLTHDAETINLRSWLDLFDAAPAPLRQRLGLGHQPVGRGHALIASGVDHLMLNRLVLASPSAIGQAVDRFGHAGVTRWMMSFPQEDLPLALALGESLGLERFRRPWQTMARLGAPPLAETSLPAGIRIVPARAEHIRAAAALFGAAFDLPPHAAPLFEAPLGRRGWTVLVALDGHDVVGVGLSHRRGSRAALVGGAVAPSHRRRGIQRAMVTERVRLALREGACLVASETGVAMPGEPNPSEGNLRRAGLVPVGVTEHLVPRGASWS